MFVLAGGAQAEPRDWPALTMTYDVTTTVNGVDIQQTRQLVYTSKDAWTETVTAAAFATPQGTFSDVGSYQKVANGQYITYDTTTGETRTETIADGALHIPRGRLSPMPLADVERHTDKSLISTSTTTRVCFDSECQDAATGWEWQDGGIVFADDARGIPVKIGNFAVTEVKVQGDKQVFESERDRDGG